MKQIFTCIVIVLFATGCSHERFTYLKKIPVKKHTTEVEKKNDLNQSGEEKIEQTENLSNSVNSELAEVKTPVLTNNALNQELAEASIEETFTPGIVEPEWKKPAEIKASDSNKEIPDSTKADSGSDGSGMAIAGFICALLGLFIFPILFSTLGVIFSAMGLKSNKKGLALAGLILGIIGLLYIIVVVAK